MKIFWLHDFRLSEYLGGAQITTEILKENSPFEVELVYPDNFSRQKVDGYPIIISNCGRFSKTDLEWIANTQKYIKHERDVAFCKYRHTLDHDCNVTCKDTVNFYNQLFNHSQLNILLSPKQIELFKKFLDLPHTTYCQVPIDTERFCYTGPKEDFYLTVAADDSYHKGIDLVRNKYNPLVYIGGNNKIPYNEIHTWYHKAKYFVYKPRVIEAFCRSVAEAFCARCELITNDNIGFLSYPWDFSDYDFVVNQISIRTASNKFWGLVKEVFG